MTYPYEAFHGGESAYVAALRRYLIERGHRADTIVSDVTRGRKSPLLRFTDAARAGEALRVRRAIRLRDGRYLSLDPRLVIKSVRGLAGRPSDRDEWHGESEKDWLLRVLAAKRYDAVILMWGASRHVDAAAELCERVLALRGFCIEREIELGSVPEIAIPADLMPTLRSAPLVGLNNRAEAQALRALMPPDRVIEVGMGFPRRPPLPPSDEPVALFVGANTPPNRRSLAWLIAAIWPLVLVEVPGARLRVVGAVGENGGFAPPPSVDLVGRVSDLEIEYRRAQVVVTPLVSGSAGVKTKVAEALSFGRPLVTTSLGADLGNPGQFGEAVDVADDAGSFAVAVAALLRDSALREARGALVREAFIANFSDEAAYGALSDRLAL